ncbi:P-loop containing nucleoside triphosphate hydrolase protein [Dendryphion nanum]|uniref:P-loop containing nucleoside triphosphate hydrolase protein n=1 Tax=Dendryphion nanum TaxID=256645 RepID=A0A9P9DXE6_9PLEO|nr:P-loop containing nucleoside triphosphate hydrolase protein [Dendryphion nanum]
MEESHSTQPDRIISRQATINIGIIGHVAHGKSTLVRAISGINAMRNNSEQALNKTIKLGYANAKTYTCDCEDCPRPTCYTSAGSEGTGSFECNRDEFKDMYRLIHHVSFVYCLGHEIYMSTMLNGAAVMDAAILLIGANEPCPRPQTSEHLAAIEILKLGGVVVVQNKVDTISLEAAFTHNAPICRFTHDTVAGKSISIPTSTTFRWNLDAALERIAHIRPPDHNLTAPPTMDVVRSFDIGRPGCQIEKLRGGITGRSFRTNGKLSWTPLSSRIESLQIESSNLDYAVPGGLIAVGSRLDSFLYLRGQLPPVYDELRIKYRFLRRILDPRLRNEKGKFKAVLIDKIVRVHVGNSRVCAKVTLSRVVNQHWKLVAKGTLVMGSETEQVDIC